MRNCLRWGIDHRLINGHVEWMNRIIKQATVKRRHYDSHAQPAAHLHDFTGAPTNILIRPQSATIAQGANPARSSKVSGSRLKP